MRRGGRRGKRVQNSSERNVIAHLILQRVIILAWWIALDYLIQPVSVLWLLVILIILTVPKLHCIIAGSTPVMIVVFLVIVVIIIVLSLISTRVFSIDLAVV